jgi:hypothetical protein
MQFYALRLNRASPQALRLSTALSATYGSQWSEVRLCAEVVEALTFKKAKIRDKEDRKLPLSPRQEVHRRGLKQ